MKRLAIGFIWSDTTNAEALPGAKGSAFVAAKHAIAQSEAIRAYAKESGYELLKLMGEKQNRRDYGSMLDDIDMIDKVILECKKQNATLIYCNVMKFRPNPFVMGKIMRYQGEIRTKAGSVVCFDNANRIQVEVRSERNDLQIFKKSLQTLNKPSELDFFQASLHLFEELEKTRKSSPPLSRKEKIKRTVQRKHRAERNKFSELIRKMDRQGLSNQAIATQLNASNVLTVNGKKWSRETVRLERTKLLKTIAGKRPN